MYKRLFSLILTGGLLSAAGCISINVNGTGGSWNTGNTKSVSGSGEVTTQNRHTSTFSAVHKRGAMNLVLQQGDTAQVQVSTDDNLQDYILTEVRDGTLYVQVKDNTTFVNAHKLLVTVTAPELTALDQDGSGDVRILPFTCNDFRLNKKGSGNLSIDADITTLTWNQDGSGNVIFNGHIQQGTMTINGSGNTGLQGKAGRLRIKKDGSGNLSAYGMPVNDLQMDKDGAGNADILVTDSLYVDMRGSGNIYSKGNPAGDVHVKGPGDFHQVK